MARAMPQYADQYAQSTAYAAQLAQGIESARADLSATLAHQHLPIARVEYAYELAYLRAFTAWERFLEDSMLRYMCGYSASHGQETLRAGEVYRSSIGQAKIDLYGGRDYILWHNPATIITRAKKYFNGSRHETIIASIHGRLEFFSAIRHRIAHAHASDDFDAATMALTGKRYRGSRPGRFLRDWTPHVVPPCRWLEAIMTEMRGLAFQIAPQ